jgi:IQ and ubiquitin-like domain-containing protein
VLILQRNFRRFILLKCVKKCAADYRALVAEQKARQAKQQENFVNKFLRECILKAQPTTKQDFDVLHAQIQKWKLSEIKRIGQQYSGGPKIAELNAVLDKEIQMLNGVEKQRQALRKEMQKLRTNKMLVDMGRPVKWVGYKSKEVLNFFEA